MLYFTKKERKSRINCKKQRRREKIKNSLAISKQLGYLISRDKCKYKFNIYRHYGVRKEGLDFHGSESPTEEEINKCYKIYEERIL